MKIRQSLDASGDSYNRLFRTLQFFRILSEISSPLRVMKFNAKKGIGIKSRFKGIEGTTGPVPSVAELGFGVVILKKIFTQNMRCR